MHRLALTTVAVAVLTGTSFAQDVKPKQNPFEMIPPNEFAQIGRITGFTVQQLRGRYPAEKQILRGVHPKDHGCVHATFKVLESIPESLRVGVFAEPGYSYQAWVRFSNAAVLLGPDSGAGKHGSRGMAIKLMGVSGKPLLDDFGPLTQDFLMVNHPVFAFSDVEDYLALSEILLRDRDDPSRFFKERIRIKEGKPDLSDPITQRALRTLAISQRIQSLSLTASPPAYQSPPASPVDNQYFSAAPFMFGTDRVMKYSVRPVMPDTSPPSDLNDPDYLRKALLARLTSKEAGDVSFDFMVQVRTSEEMQGKLDTEIEDACVEWDEKKFPFVTVAKLTIAPQNFDTPERRAQCESLFFTPWHGISEHQPIGGINRLRLGVYRASSGLRRIPKEPAGF